jgi:hypothetical protein
LGALAGILERPVVVNLFGLKELFLQVDKLSSRILLPKEHLKLEFASQKQIQVVP